MTAALDRRLERGPRQQGRSPPSPNTRSCSRRRPLRCGASLSWKIPVRRKSWRCFVRSCSVGSEGGECCDEGVRSRQRGGSSVCGDREALRQTLSRSGDGRIGQVSHAHRHRLRAAARSGPTTEGGGDGPARDEQARCVCRDQRHDRTRAPAERVRRECGVPANAGAAARGRSHTGRFVAFRAGPLRRHAARTCW